MPTSKDQHENESEKCKVEFKITNKKHIYKNFNDL